MAMRRGTFLYTRLAAKYSMSSRRAARTRSGFSTWPVIASVKRSSCSATLSSIVSPSAWQIFSSSTSVIDSSGRCRPTTPRIMRPSTLIWLRKPWRIALHRANVYTAVPAVTAPAAGTCVPPAGLLHRPCRPWHRRARLLSTSGGLLMNFVGFFTGLPHPSSWPYWHRSPTTRSTSSWSSTSSIGTSFHDLAVSGCSCRKYRPASSCARSSSHINSMCTMAAVCSRRTTSGSRFLSLIACHEQKRVQGGDPIRNIGFSLKNLALAACRRSAMLKSHGTPNSSVVVRSMEKPGAMPRCLSFPAAAATLGGEYISLTVTGSAPRS